MYFVINIARKTARQEVQQCESGANAWSLHSLSKYNRSSKPQQSVQSFELMLGKALLAGVEYSSRWKIQVDIEVDRVSLYSCGGCSVLTR